MKYLKPLLSLAFAVGLTYLFNHPLGMIPALGKFLSPFEGFWQNAEAPLTAPTADLNIEGLKGEVTVQYDENRVPHIFADNDEDAYMVQGYLTAKDRLWQMEFYTLAAAGRLSEIVGERSLELDRYNRRIGMAAAAKNIAEEMLKNPTAKSVMESYAAGVNAYIKQAKYKNLPVEYKILGYEPETWSPYKTILMLQNMRSVLNGGSDDYRMSNAVAKYGQATIDELFPNYPSNESPIVPVGTKWNFKPLPIPPVPAQIATKPADSPVESAKPEIGSNNWAVHGSKSATGLPILSNDPHLMLTLPSIWYQVQLITPNMNVYGVALPGTPGVTIGFNEDIAWGVTNVASDVMDFYQIKFKDKSKQNYWHDGTWKPTRMVIEEFKIKGKKKALKDTVYHTHHGPIVYNEGATSLYPNIPTGHAMRWIAHEQDGADLLAFYYLNRAKNYDDYRKALTYYTAPAQNFVFASNQNDISITPNGKFPLKWKGQGKYILDGSNPAHDWQGFIPANHNPTVKNPPRGFVSSANQFSTDPTYPYYLGWKFSPSERGIRINERLSAMQKATADSLRLLQNDNFNVEARRILPKLLVILGQDSIQKIHPAYIALKNWDMRNESNSMSASIFETWIKELRRAIWEDDFPSNKDAKIPMLYPSRDKTDGLIEKNPTAKWYDDASTKDKVETLQDIVKMSFGAALDTLTKNNGPMNPATWQWANVKSTDIGHLGRIPGLGRMNIENGGGAGIVNATTDKTGPSWRMIVELGKNGSMKAYGLYPGGQSGNPGSPYYDNMVDKWAKGELNELLYLRKKDEKSTKIVQTLKVR